MSTTTDTTLKDKGVICLLLAGITLVVAIVVGICFAIFSRDFVEVDATVTGTERVENVEGDITTFTLLEYTYEGESYNGRVDYHSTDLHVGDPLTVEVDPENPERVFYEGQYGLVVILGLLAALFFVPGIILYLLGAFLEKRQAARRDPPRQGPFYSER